MKKFTAIFSTFFVMIALVMISASAFPEQVRMVALGDSITFGTGDPQKLGYIGRFSAKYEADNGRSITISNFGIPKYTTNDTLQQLKGEHVRRSLTAAQYIILYIGTNDFRVCADYKFGDLQNEKMNRGKQRFSDNLNKILTEIRSENDTAPIVVLGLYHPYTQYKNDQQIYATINDWNKEIYDCTTKYERTIFVPTADLFFDKPKQSCFSDSLHLNGYGYELMANRLLETFKSIE
ncbi:GDSL-type esterase/lipase family protein [Bacillus sp. T3]|uniref:GDSL-type esterase/lipase family protein n=1 Tax=Bacillus sp. T3 TaxID=467262 RepID=UPI0029810235|nr:GDSL-type esterase/lipase family protein [Bacillus sp. T3]